MDPKIEQVPMASRGASNLLGKPGTKTKSPLPLDKAKSYLERFVEKQKRKDYLTELPAEKNVKKSAAKKEPDTKYEGKCESTVMEEKITLYYKQGTSDKVYEVWMEITPSRKEAMVYFAFGRRGSNLQGGPKTNSPMPLDEAQSYMERLADEKIRKGYQAEPPRRSPPKWIQ